ncbi:hypothetical protein, partial [Streptomyces monomycini]
FGGLMAVPLGAGATRLDCSYRTPGLLPGLAASGGALLALTAVAVTCGVRRRTARPGAPAPSASSSPQSPLPGSRTSTDAVHAAAARPGERAES